MALIGAGMLLGTLAGAYVAAEVAWRLAVRYGIDLLLELTP